MPTTDPTPTDPTAAIEAANYITYKVQLKRVESPGSINRIDEMAEVCADFIRFNEDALLSLPTHVPTAKTAAEAAGIKGPVRVREIQWEGDYIADGNGNHVSLEDVCDALNAPARVQTFPNGICDHCGTPLEFAGWWCPGGNPEAITDRFDCPLCFFKGRVEELEKKLAAPAPAPVAGEGGLFEGGRPGRVSEIGDPEFTLPRGDYFYIEVGTLEIKGGVLRDDGKAWSICPRSTISPGEVIFCDRHGNPLPVPTPGAGDAGGEVEA